MRGAADELIRLRGIADGNLPRRRTISVRGTVATSCRGPKFTSTRSPASASAAGFARRRTGGSPWCGASRGGWTGGTFPVSMPGASCAACSVSSTRARPLCLLHRLGCPAHDPTRPPYEFCRILRRRASRFVLDLILQAHDIRQLVAGALRELVTREQLPDQPHRVGVRLACVSSASCSRWTALARYQRARSRGSSAVGTVGVFGGTPGFLVTGDHLSENIHERPTSDRLTVAHYAADQRVALPQAGAEVMLAEHNG